MGGAAGGGAVGGTLVGAGRGVGGRGEGGRGGGGLVGGIAVGGGAIVGGTVGGTRVKVGRGVDVFVAAGSLRAIKSPVRQPKSAIQNTNHAIQKPRAETGGFTRIPSESDLGLNVVFRSGSVDHKIILVNGFRVLV